MSTPNTPNSGSLQLPAGGLQIKIESKNSEGMPYLKADYFQISRIADDFSMIVHQSNYQHIVDELQAGQTVVENNATIAVGKFAMSREGFLRLRDQIEEIYTKWQTQIGA